MPADSHAQGPAAGVRADLHCHSNASSEAGEAVLGAINCPESFSEPHEVYAQAKGRGMDFVTITDHDCIDGVEKLGRCPDVLVGEEVTCFFPEDHCKIHVLVWGIGRHDHDALQSVASDIYQVARYIERHRIAHAVAHPLYRQNDRMERWHVARLLLLFKGFECLNGSHSLLHRQEFEPLLDELTPLRISELAAEQGIVPLWPEPWLKARTGGSDDHGLLNVGRTWTEFPADVQSIDELLDCLRHGRCRPGGEAGSSLKLAHNFYGVGIRYYAKRMAGRGATAGMLRTLTGDGRLRKRDLVKAAVSSSLAAVGRQVRRPFRLPQQPPSGMALLSGALRRSLRTRLPASSQLLDALRTGRAPLGEHDSMFELVRGLDRDATGEIVAAVARAMPLGDIGPIFDSISAVAAQQFFLMPYYFALFHQNRERHLFARMTGRDRTPAGDKLKLALFTDRFDGRDGVSRSVRMLCTQAARGSKSLMVHTCGAAALANTPFRKNFVPLASIPVPIVGDVRLSLPPVAEILEWADRQQFDAIHIATSGPMGLCGTLAAAMLRVPLLATYQSDVPAFVADNTGDDRLIAAAECYQNWFFGCADRVLARSRWYERRLGASLKDPAKVCMLPPAVDGEAFCPARRDSSMWVDLGVCEPYRLLFAGRVGPEKSLRSLADVFERLCRRRRDVGLIVAGDGPYLPTLRKCLEGLPAYFVGPQDDNRLAALYAGSDLLVFPSRTDTLAQVVLEAQASGLPALVTTEGGAQEVMDDGVTGLALPAGDPARWAAEIDALLNDEPRRQRMSRTASQRAARCSVERMFEAFWDEHVRAVREAAARNGQIIATPPAPAREPGNIVRPAEELTA